MLSSRPPSKQEKDKKETEREQWEKETDRLIFKELEEEEEGRKKKEEKEASSPRLETSHQVLEGEEEDGYFMSEDFKTPVTGHRAEEHILSSSKAQTERKVLPAPIQMSEPEQPEQDLYETQDYSEDEFEDYEDEFEDEEDEEELSD